MKEELDKLVLAGKLHRHHVEPLMQLVTLGFCLHRSWGCGRITGVDTVFGRISIDFPSKPGHTMDLAFAVESLRPISRDHILARKISELGALREMAGLNHLDLIKLVLQSYGGKATAEQVQQVLVPDVITEDWKKWWDMAKREMKKDGHFVVPLKKAEPIVYQEREVSLEERLLHEFTASKGLKARLAVAGEILRNLEDFADRERAAAEVVNALNLEINSHQRTQPSLALEAVFTRDELRQACGLPGQEGEVSASDIWAQNVEIGKALAVMPGAKHKRALQSFKAANPEHWHEVVLASLNELPAKVCTECVNLLVEEGHFEPLRRLMTQLINRHTASSEFLLWLARERSDAFADILGPEVFRAMLTAIERDQFNEKKSNRLRDYVVDDQELLVELIASADIEVIKDLTRALQLSSSFDDMDKRSLLARIVKSFPPIQSLISGEHARQDTALVVSWASLEKRKQEYDELVQRRIPANSREIAHARSYGDLSENHEYKAAKEMQKLLIRRKAELETQLARARGADFANPNTEAVSVGTRVHLTELNTQQPEGYTILGAWDFDVEQGVISYLSPLAQALLGKRVGQEVELEVEGVRKRLRIESIEPWRKPEPVESPEATRPSSESQPPEAQEQSAAATSAAELVPELSAHPEAGPS